MISALHDKIVGEEDEGYEGKGTSDRDSEGFGEIGRVVALEVVGRIDMLDDARE